MKLVFSDITIIDISGHRNAKINKIIFRYPDDDKKLVEPVEARRTKNQLYISAN
jgi:hypothetical protein